jgi:hypothetical protein
MGDMDLSECAKDLFVEATQASSDAPLLALLPPQQSNLGRHRAWAPHHRRGLFSSIAPHVAAAVIPPSAMSTKTSSGVPRVIILPTLVVVLSISVQFVPHVGVEPM